MAVPRHEYPTLTALRQDASHQARRQAYWAADRWIGPRLLTGSLRFGASSGSGELPQDLAVPVTEFASAWPDGVPVQVHGMDADPIVVGKGAIDAARELIGQAKDAELSGSSLSVPLRWAVQVRRPRRRSGCR
jgi:hypothetical protein